MRVPEPPPLNVSVAIIGAGLSGLCLAQNLLRRGVDVHVFERDPSPFARPQGYRITVDRFGLDALRQSVPETLYDLAIATASASGGVFRFTNSQLRDAFSMTFAESDDAERQMDRQVLRAVLLIGLEDRVHYGSGAASVHHDGEEGTRVLFDDGTSVTCRAVIGADGIRSALRQQIVSSEAPLDSGSAAIYGRTPLVQNGVSVIPASLARSGVLALGDGQGQGRAVFFTSMQFGERPARAFARLTPGADALPDEDYVMWAVVVRESELTKSESSDSGSLRRFAAGLVQPFHPLVGRLVATADPDATILSRIAIARRPGTWTIPTAALVGDAVHAMPPFGAHGGNTALRDAALLGEELGGAFMAGGSTGDVAAALIRYRDAMIPYAFEAVDAAAKQMKRLTETEGLQKWLMLKVMPRFHRVTVPQEPGQEQRVPQR